jgi:mannose-6-phosphate isomerase-like protein (cupin superfamily)
VSDVQRFASVDASILELAYRYPQKRVDKARLVVDGSVFHDINGDGIIEAQDGGPAPHEVSVFKVLCSFFPDSPEIAKTSQTQLVYETIQNLAAGEGMAHAFIATCGSTAVEIHQVRGHSVLWASIPPGARPNEVHRHLGGSVYCLFYKGEGEFHRVDPYRGFETLPIRITNANSYQMVAIPTHLWYQPINTSDIDLQYFMIHEPAFDRSELLVLNRGECRQNWGFQY